MATRPGSNLSVSTADVLVAMLTSDLRGSWAERGAPRRGERAAPDASAPPTAAGEPADSGEPADTGEPAAPADSTS